MKKRIFLAVFLSAFMLTGLISGVAMASTFTMTGVEGTSQEPYVGQINLTTNPVGQFQWGYCVEQSAHSWLGTAYTFTLGNITGYRGDNQNFGLIAADLIWKEYNDGAVSNGEKNKLQHDIWNAWTNYSSSYVLTYSADLLESLFDIANVPNSQCGEGQDLIVFRPVPEPTTLLLLGLGLVGMGVAARRKFVK
jgi:hypothetical protein